MPLQFEVYIPINQFCRIEFVFNLRLYTFEEFRGGGRDPERVKVSWKPELRLEGSIPHIPLHFTKGHPYAENPGAPQRESSAIQIAQNETNAPQLIILEGAFNKRFADGKEGWMNSDGRLLVDDVNNKRIGYNSHFYPNNYDMVICNIVFY